MYTESMSENVDNKVILKICTLILASLIGVLWTALHSFSKDNVKQRCTPKKRGGAKTPTIITTHKRGFQKPSELVFGLTVR